MFVVKQLSLLSTTLQMTIENCPKAMKPETDLKTTNDILMNY